MAKKDKIQGTLHQRNGRWWWRVKLPGDEKYKAIPLKVVGHKQAYKGEKAVAVEIAKRVFAEAILKQNQGNRMDFSFDGTVASLVKEFLAYADEAYRKVDGSITH